eukprot:NODE_2028_length_2309_cov_4.710357.p1 GENE.NODE_2028_length_2309_cov_4.710357~~NODE_2028_length_2309_cov_4.710357.p1  ORF type:complete len:744 (+),score=158.08 NODE_2028_length_2309_cov_4.710357:283-2232(+)
MSPPSPSMPKVLDKCAIPCEICLLSFPFEEYAEHLQACADATAAPAASSAHCRSPVSDDSSAPLVRGVTAHRLLDGPGAVKAAPPSCSLVQVLDKTVIPCEICGMRYPFEEFANHLQVCASTTYTVAASTASTAICRSSASARHAARREPGVAVPGQTDGARVAAVTAPRRTLPEVQGPGTPQAAACVEYSSWGTGSSVAAAAKPEPVRRAMGDALSPFRCMLQRTRPSRIYILPDDPLPAPPAAVSSSARATSSVDAKVVCGARTFEVLNLVTPPPTTHTGARILRDECSEGKYGRRVHRGAHLAASTSRRATTDAGGDVDDVPARTETTLPQAPHLPPAATSVTSWIEAADSLTSSPVKTPPGSEPRPVSWNCRLLRSRCYRAASVSVAASPGGAAAAGPTAAPPRECSTRRRCRVVLDDEEDDDGPVCPHLWKLRKLQGERQGVNSATAPSDEAHALTPRRSPLRRLGVMMSPPASVDSSPTGVWRRPHARSSANTSSSRAASLAISPRVPRARQRKRQLPASPATAAGAASSPGRGVALVVQKYWLELILQGAKTWEIRGKTTDRRGIIKLAQSGTGMLLGHVRLVDCVAVDRANFASFVEKHRVSDVSLVPYRRIYAWVLTDAMRYDVPRKYQHNRGAVVWVKL